MKNPDLKKRQEKKDIVGVIIATIFFIALMATLIYGVTYHMKLFQLGV